MVCLSISASVPLVAEYIPEEHYVEMAAKFYSWEKGNEDDSLIRQQAKDLHLSRSFESYTHYHEYAITEDETNPTYINKILIIVKDTIYIAMPSYIIRYAHDIHNTFGCAVDIESVNGETAPQIRALIQTYAADLDGVVFVGDIVPAFYYHTAATNWEEETFTCDLFFMDLNGTWQQSATLGIYNDHNGNVAPEIFVGRINTSTMNRDEVQELKCFFDKDHQYWTGKKVLNKQRALTYTYSDWDNSSFRNSVSPLYGSNNYSAVHGSLFNKGNYCTDLQDDAYEFIQMACHSSSIRHNFRTATNNLLYEYEISPINTKQIGYNLFCCHACDWMTNTDRQCLGESYLFGLNNNSSTLALVGSTKTGGMLYGFSSFYTPLGNGRCIGDAFKQWWIEHCGSLHTAEEKRWFYGMVILGDPLIDFNFTNECEDILYLNGGEESTNNMYYAQSKIVVQNYSLTQGQSVTLSAPSIQINGPFVCNSSSSLMATPNDNCICNSTRPEHRNSLKRNNEYLSSKPFYPLWIYPNPAREVVTIESTEELNSIAIYHQSGQCVVQISKLTSNIIQIPTSLPNGIYIVQATTKEGSILQKKLLLKK